MNRLHPTNPRFAPLAREIDRLLEEDTDLPYQAVLDAVEEYLKEKES